MTSINYSSTSNLKSHCCECSKKIDQLSEDLSLRNMRIKNLLDTIEGLRSHVEEVKYESYRWWLAHDTLRAQFESAQHGRIGKTMRLLHVICRLRNKALQGVKRCLRPVVLNMVKKILARPRLYRVIKPIVGRFPFVYKKLRTLSMNEIMGGVQSVFFDDDDREHAAIYLDKSAARILMDLRQAKSRK